MGKTKSSEKNATNANKCDIDNTQLKYEFFPAFAKANKQPEETVDHFMSRIGMESRRPDYKQYRQGNKNITELFFNKIRIAMRWDHIETAKWEAIWEKDQVTKGIKLKRKPLDDASEATQTNQTETDTTDDTNAENKTPEKHEDHCCVRVRPLESFADLNDRLCEAKDSTFKRLVTSIQMAIDDDDISGFAERFGLPLEWFDKAFREGIVAQLPGIAEMKKFFDGMLMPKAIQGYVALNWAGGKRKQDIFSEWRACISSAPHVCEAQARKANGSSGS
jgi:hypothetical protein